MQTSQDETPIQDALEANRRAIEAPNTKALSQATQTYLNEIKLFEQDRVEMAKQSAKTAWKVATATTTITIVALVALAVTMPLKEVEPYLLSVDTQTGLTTMLKPLADGQKISYGDVLDRHWLNTYVIERNSYVWQSVQHSFDTVKLMSTPNVLAPYQSYILGEKSPVKMFKDKQVIDVTVKNITFLPRSSSEQGMAQVQFTRDVQSSGGKAATGYKPTTWTAMITFDYQASIRTEKERRLNPLGFRVTSYREDRLTL